MDISYMMAGIFPGEIEIRHKEFATYEDLDYEVSNVRNGKGLNAAEKERLEAGYKVEVKPELFAYIIRAFEERDIGERYREPILDEIISKTANELLKEAEEEERENEKHRPRREIEIWAEGLEKTEKENPGWEEHDR